MTDINKRLTRLFFLIAVMIVVWLVFLEPAEAEDITLSWTLPTGSEVCTNDPTVPDIQATRVWQLVKETGPTDTSTVLPNMLPGDYTYVASVVDTQGQVSRFSGTTTKTVTAFIAPAGTTVYQPVSISTGFWMIPMGTVTADTQCDETQRANDYYRVPTSAVTWNEGVTAEPVFVVAACG